MKKKTLFMLLIGLVVLIGGASILYNTFAGGDSADNAQSEVEKSLVPDFVVYDIDGKEVKLSDFKGKPVVVNFWASWCGPCKSEMPDFDEKAKELEGKVQFLMINVTDGSQETVESASQFIKGEGYTFPVFYDTAMNASSTYGATSLPMTFFIDAEGYGIARAVGAIDSATLQQGIDMILE